MTPPSAAAPGAWVVALCGIGRLPFRVAPGASEPEPFPAHLAEEAQEAAMAQLLPALDRGGARERAAAVMLRGRDTVTGGSASSTEDKETLRAMVSTETDPVITVWALQRCSFENSPCRAAMAKRWLQQEPDSAAAWAAALVQEPQRRDEARQRMALLTGFDNHFGALAATALNAMPPEVLPYVQTLLMARAIGIEAAFGFAELQSLTALCKPPPAAGSPELRQCDAIARLMVEHADTLLVRRVGLRLGEAVGWGPQDRLRREWDAQLNAAVAAVDTDQPMSCAAVARLLNHVRAVGTLGEAAAIAERAAAVSAVSASRRVPALTPYSAAPPQSR